MRHEIKELIKIMLKYGDYVDYTPGPTRYYKEKPEQPSREDEFAELRLVKGRERIAEIHVDLDASRHEIILDYTDLLPATNQIIEDFNKAMDL